MRSFFRELRDRHVVKVGVAYLVIGWLVLQLADVIFPAMHLPDWTITLALALLAIGFPVALVLAWVFDITPHGIERTAATGDGPPPGDADRIALRPVASGDGPPPAAGGNATSPVASAVASWSVPAQPPVDRSLAVLPLTDMSPDHDHEHFCDGLTEELLNVLSAIPGLRVASRTSSFAFKNRDTDLAEIAAKLRVSHILEGSVRKDGSKVRITVQLIEIATDSHTWSSRYDRELCDIFSIQDDIAARILDALKLKLGDRTLPRTTTEDPRAYEYYLRGRGFFFTKAEADLERAVDMFCKATQADPAFIRAWISLAEASAMQAIFVGGGDAAIRTAKYASDKAMALAPNRADSLMVRGFAHFSALKLDEAEADFLKAFELDAGQTKALHYLARVAYHRGDKAATRDYFVRATDADPEDWESPLLAIGPFQEAGDTEGAARMARIGVERAEAHLKDYPDNPRAHYLSLAGLKLLGLMDRAHAFADRALELAPDDAATRYNLACFYAQIGAEERALDLLEGSIRSRSWVENDSDLASIRSHPRYHAMLETLTD